MENIISEIDKVLKKANRSYSLAETNVADLKEIVEKIQKGNVVYKESFIEIFEKYLDELYELLHNYAIAAAKKSKEYDYDLYINRLSESIYNAKISLVLSGKSINLNVDMRSVGDIYDWASAVKTARSMLSSGITRHMVIGENNPYGHPAGSNLAYIFWKEKIYGAGREGKKVERRRWSKKAKRYYKYGVTGEYKSKYRNTILTRLSLASGAPFWYLIEHGNANFPGNDDVANGYPSVKPQRFINQFVRSAQQLLSTRFVEIRQRVEKEWLDFISSQLEIPITEKLEKLLMSYDKDLSIDINNLKEIKKLKKGSIIGRIETMERKYDIIYKKSSIGLRYKVNQ